MDYIDGIRPARTGYCWTVRNKKLTPPIPNPLIMLPQLPSSDLLQVLRHLIQSLHSISTLFGLLQYLYSFYSSPFACNLSYFSICLIFHFHFSPQIPHLQSSFASRIFFLFTSILPQLFNPCISIKYHGEAKP